MAAVNLSNAAVTGAVNAPIPNPILPINNPAIVDPENAADLLAPFTLSVIGAGVIGSPVIVAPESIPAQDLPVIVTPESVPASATPTIVTSESVPTTALPTAITAIALPSSTPPYSLKHARILYDNLLLGSAVTTTAGANGSYTLIPNTADRWTLTDTGSITFTLASAVDMDTVSIGAHNLGFNGFTVSVEYSIDLVSAFLSFKATQSPSEDTAMMFHNQSTVSVRRLKIDVTGTGSVFVGSIYSGIALQMQRPFFAGHTPITLSATTSRYSSMSEGGNFIGEQIRRIGYSTSADWSNLENAWLRLYFKPFMIHARTLPYYFAWNLLEEPLDIGYCKTSEDIKPAYSGVRNLLDVSFKMVGFG